MDVALSDVLTCPRCGPAHGLILVPDEVRSRRVITGVLGCANCRERYPVADGVADLRAGAPDPDPALGMGHGPREPDPEAALRMAALLGLAGGGGMVLLSGPAAAFADALAGMLPELSVVAADHGGRGGTAVSVLRVGAAFPLRSGAFVGVALTGGRAGLVEEGARLLAPAGRLVLEPAPEGAVERARALGLRVLLEQEQVLVVGGER